MVFLTWAAVFIFAVAALRDLAFRCIDDALVVALLLGWGAWAAIGGLVGWDIALHITTGLAAFFLMWGAFAMGWMGGGDVKLAAAVFLWAGPDNALGVAAIVSIVGLVLAICCLLASPLARLSLPRPFPMLVATFAKERGVPYGVALSAGGVLAALASLAPGG